MIACAGQRFHLSGIFLSDHVTWIDSEVKWVHDLDWQWSIIMRYRGVCVWMFAFSIRVQAISLGDETSISFRYLKTSLKVPKSSNKKSFWNLIQICLRCSYGWDKMAKRLNITTQHWRLWTVFLLQISLYFSIRYFHIRKYMYISNNFEEKTLIFFQDITSKTVSYRKFRSPEAHNSHREIQHWIIFINS